MQVNRFFFLILVFTLTFFNSVNYCIYRNSAKSDKGNKYNLSIGELKQSIRINGFNYDRLFKLSFYLSNFQIDFPQEKIYLNSLKDTNEKDFLKSLLLKRQNKFQEMYSLLFDRINSQPQFYEFYEELIFAAQASQNIPMLKEYYESKTTSVFNIYAKCLIYISLGEFLNAKQEIEELIKIKNSDYHPYYQLSMILKNLGDYDGAFKSLKEAAKIAKQDTYFKPKEYLQEGVLFYFSGNNKEARFNFTKALKISRELHDLISESKALVDIGIILDEEGNTDSSRSYFHNSLQIAKSIGNIENEASVYSELGVSLTFTNQFIEAKENYLKSIDLYSKSGVKVRLAFLYNNLGRVYQNYFNYGAALKSFNNGLESAGENKRAKIQSLMGMADIFSNLSNFSKALDYYNQAKQLSSELHEISSEAEIDLGIGSLNYNLDQYDNALRYFRQAERLFIKINNPYQLPGIYDKIGLTLLNMDSLSEAENYFNKGISTSVRISDEYGKLNTLINLASVQLKKKELNKSADLLSHIHLSVNGNLFNEFAAQKYLLLGKLNSMRKKTESAKTYFNDAILLSKKNNLNETAIEAYFELAKLLEKNYPLEAEKNYESAIKVIEVISRPLFENEEVQIAYFSGRSRIYNSFIEFYLKSGKYEKAFELINASRSRNTMRNFNNLILESLINDKNKLGKLYEFDWMINSGLYKESEDSLRNEYEKLKSSLVHIQPELNKYLILNKDTSLTKIQNKLDKNEYLLSFFISDNISFLFVTGKNVFQPIRLKVKRDEIKELISGISPYFNPKNKNIIVNQDLFSFNALNSFRLYEEILKPAVKFIPKDSKIIIIPSTDLMVIPFEFLVTNYNYSESPFDYKNKNFLLFSYNISYAPSPSAYLELKYSHLKNNDDVLLLGDPSVDNSNIYTARRGLLSESMGSPRNLKLLPLKYSKDEILQIHKIIDAKEILLSNDATESNFKKYSHLKKVIHLSTHSFLFNKRPLIFFSDKNDDKDDGFLEAGEIVQLRLNSELVVLSSCNSGLGKIDEAEGILGMTKAFFEAGAKSVVVSLWEVNDNYTSKLMSIYYEKLSNGLNKSEAFRQAKIEFIKKYSPNPYFWSAFILSGDTSNLELPFRNTLPFYVIGTTAIFLGFFFLFMLLKNKKS